MAFCLPKKSVPPEPSNMSPTPEGRGNPWDLNEDRHAILIDGPTFSSLIKWESDHKVMSLIVIWWKIIHEWKSSVQYQFKKKYCFTLLNWLLSSEFVFLWLLSPWEYGNLRPVDPNPFIWLGRPCLHQYLRSIRALIKFFDLGGRRESKKDRKDRSVVWLISMAGISTHTTYPWNNSRLPLFPQPSPQLPQTYRPNPCKAQTCQ